MDFLFDMLLGRPILSIGVGTFLSGSALLYLVIQRTRKHRLEQNRNAEV